jgi:hypothetical protein
VARQAGGPGHWRPRRSAFGLLYDRPLWLGRLVQLICRRRFGREFLISSDPPTIHGKCSGPGVSSGADMVVGDLEVRHHTSPQIMKAD